MQRENTPEGSPFTMGHRNRGTSFSVDSPQLSRYSTFAPPLVVPQPQYVAGAAAAQIIAADQEITGDDESDFFTSVGLTTSALNLLNGFLDHLLFNILLSAKSTKLISIRPAVSDVLKPRLAKEVVTAADEELREYMGGGSDEELSDFHGGQQPTGQFELERSWKLTRLKCMVYTRLGDLEEEDEEEYLERQGLDDSSSRRPGRFSHIGHVTPAAAIFLTSILEYIGECAIVISGEAAHARLVSPKSPTEQDQTQAPEVPSELFVDDVDVEKLALNATLGRLWRMWRRNVRVPMLSRTLSRESMARRRFPSKQTSRQSSIATINRIEETVDPDVSERFASHEEGAESVDPTNVPLPLSEHDVDEIEVPGFTSHLATAMRAHAVRPRSLFLSGAAVQPPITHDEMPKASPISPYSRERGHGRSSSLPRDLYPLSSPHSFASGGEVASPYSRDAERLRTMQEADELNGVHPLHQGAVGLAISQDYERPSRRKQSFDDASSVSSMQSDHAALSGPPDIDRERAPSPITHEEAQILQRKAEQTRAASAEDHAPLPQESLRGQPPMATKRSSAQSQHSSSERSLKHASGASPHYSHPHRPARDDSMDSGPIVETSFVSRNAKTTSQHPRLAQLKEAVDAASGGSDRNAHPDIEPKSAPADVTAQPPFQASRHHQRPSTSAQRVVDPAPGPGTERAAVQRVSPPFNGRGDSSSPKPRRSESIGSSRDRRPKTSGSGGSQVSGKLKSSKGRQPTDNNGSYRTSSDTNRASMKPAEHTRDTSDLESLIQSEETIHYTLTPRNMRQMEDGDSPRWAPVRSGTNEEAEPSIRSRRPSDTAKPPVRTRAPSASKVQPVEQKAPLKPTGQKAPLNPAPPIKPKAPGRYQAREATTELESLREFADFIRTTGPEEEAARDNRQARGSTMQQNGKSRASQSHTPIVAVPNRQSSTSRTSGSAKKSGPKLQARAAVSQNDHTSELIDFLREGPPGASTSGVPKSNNMDSDDFQTSSAVSMHDNSTISKSATSSYNSRSGLLDNKRSDGRTRAAQPSPLQAVSGTANGSQGPSRKQRRVRDPYAIDSDSDEDFDDEPSGVQAPKEESLADFLRNATPPPETNQPQPLFQPNQRPQNDQPPKSRSTISRLMRTSSTDKRPKPKASAQSFQTSKSAGNVSSSRPPRTSTHPAVPQTGPPKTHRTNPQQGGGGANGSRYVGGPADSPRNGGNATPRTAEPQRPPGGYRSETAELADFLKNTGPPPGPTRVRSNDSMDEGKISNSKSLGRMFLRKKKQAV